MIGFPGIQRRVRPHPPAGRDREELAAAKAVRVCLLCLSHMLCSLTLPRRLGAVDLTTVEKVEIKITDEEKARQERVALRPPLDEILSLHDFEVRPYIPSLLVIFSPFLCSLLCRLVAIPRLEPT